MGLEFKHRKREEPTLKCTSMQKGGSEDSYTSLLGSFLTEITIHETIRNSDELGHLIKLLEVAKIGMEQSEKIDIDEFEAMRKEEYDVNNLFNEGRWGVLKEKGDWFKMDEFLQEAFDDYKHKILVEKLKKDEINTGIEKVNGLELIFKEFESFCKEFKEFKEIKRKL